MPLQDKRVMPDPNEPGVQDATVSDFLLPLLLGKMGSAAMPAAAGEAGGLAADVEGPELHQAMLRSMAEPARGYAAGGSVDNWDGEKDNRLTDFLKQTFSGPSRPPAVDGLPPVPPSDMDQNNKDMVAFSKVEGADEGPSDSEQELNQKIEDSHPGLQANDLPGYVKGQEAQVDRFGPDKQAALMQSLQKQYGSTGNTIAKGGASIADAIMQGVARAGSGGNLAAIDQREQQNLDRAATMGKSLNEQNLQAMGAKQKLEGMDSSTPLGKSYLDSLELMAKEMYPQLSHEQFLKVARNPAAFQSILPFKIDLEKVKGELAMKDAMLGVQNENYRAQRKNDEQKLKEDAAKAYGSRGIAKRMRDAVSESPESRVLREQMEGVKSFDSEKEAEAANLPKGTIITVGGRRARIK